MKKYSNLFAPGRIGSLPIKNRVIMAPMATNFADPNGTVTDNMIQYYIERARGGVGLIIVENANVDYPMGNNGAVQLRIDEDRFVPTLACLREAIYDAEPSCKVAIQINHAGGQTTAARTGGLQVVAPSGIVTRTGGEIPRPLTVAEIQILVEKFALAAERAKKAGFDAVEVHGGFGYLLAQFLSPLCNQRTDQYGGSIENRVRFPVEIVKRIRTRLGRDFPILFRLNGDECVPGGSTLNDTTQYAQLLEAASVNLLHISAGCGFCAVRHIEPMPYPQGVKAELTAAIKASVSIPVAVVGVIREPEVAEQILTNKQADFIAMGRTLIADPHWVNKISRDEVFQHCLSCNECARRRVYSGLPIRCSVNPVVGNEGLEQGRYSHKPDPKKILIVGGGPAGLKAAIEAGKDGHEVILLEKRQALGGRGIIAACPPHKEKIQWLLADLTRQVLKYGVKVQLEIEVTQATIQQIQPDILILAVGSETEVPSWLTKDKEFCLLAEDILEKQYSPKNMRIGVIGGGSVGCETAEYLADAGNEVTIVEMADSIAADLEPITRTDLVTRIQGKGIGIKAQSRVLAIAPGSIAYEADGQTNTIQVDLIVYAGGFRAETKFMTGFAAEQAAIPVYVIGDCRKAGRFVDAIRQAYMAVRDIRILR